MFDWHDSEPTAIAHRHNKQIRTANVASVLSIYYVEDYQQYLAKNPHGYRCHANTGVKFPETA